MIALYPGAFKPPHRGHFEVVKALLNGTHRGSVYDKENSAEKGKEALDGKAGKVEKITKVVVFPGGGVRNGISKDEAREIWQIYAKHLPGIEIADGQKNPMFAAKDYARDNQDQQFYAVTGVRDESDFADLRRVTTFSKVDNVQGLVIPSADGQGIRATNLRKAVLDGSLDDIRDFFPKELTREELLYILKMLKDNIIAENMLKAMSAILDEQPETKSENSSGTAIQPHSAIKSDDRQQLVYLYDYIKRLIPPKFVAQFNQSSILIKPKNPSFLSETEKPKIVDYIGSLLEYMLDQKMNITPLPEIKTVKDETNAADFFGKTAYYDPNNREIVLYTEGRHPKDVVRSFSHEMIHHMQNIEGRLGNISTQNTNEDDHLMEIEKEAYLLGNITFRNWEDSLKNPKEEVNEIPMKDLKKIDSYADKQLDPVDVVLTDKHFFDRLNDPRNGKEISQAELIGFFKRLAKKKKSFLDFLDKYQSVVATDDRTNINIPFMKLANKAIAKTIMRKKDFKTSTPVHNLQEGKYDTIVRKLSSIAFEMFKDIHDRGDKSGEFELRVGNPEHDDVDIESTQFEFDFLGTVKYTDDTYKVDGGANAGFDDDGEEIQPMINVSFEIPKNPDWQEVSMDLKDVVRHELEHLTQDGENLKQGKYIPDDQDLRNLMNKGLLDKDSYFTLPKEVDAMIQGLYYKAKKSKKPFADVVDDYLNKAMISLDNKEKVLKLWRKRLPALGIKQEL